MRPAARALLPLAALAVVLAGCSDVPQKASPHAPDRSSARVAPPRSAKGEAPPGEPIHVGLEQWVVVTDYGSAPAGEAEFDVTNLHGWHEFDLLRTDRPAGRLPLSGHTVDLAKAGTLVAHVDAFGDGETHTVKADLKPGHYVLLCNLPDHYARGMWAAFTAA